MGEIIAEIFVDYPSVAARDIRQLGHEWRAAVIYTDAESLRDAGSNEFRELIDAASSSAAVLILTVKGSGEISAEIPEAFHLCFLSEEVHLLDDGKSLTAAEAASSGLVNAAIEERFVQKTAMEAARKIVDLAPIAVRSCAEAVRKGMRSGLDGGLDIELNLFCRLFSTSDMREGTRAFLEKRAPVFDGE
jgi:hypothetical protein